MAEPWEQDWSKQSTEGSTGAPWEQDWSGQPKKKKGGAADQALDALETANSYRKAISSGVLSGIANTAAGVGTFVQAPAANTLSGVMGAKALADRGLTWLIDKAGGDAQLDQQTQEDAQLASRFAAETRAANVRGKPGETVNFGTDLARMGRDLQDTGRAASQALDDYDQNNNPELIRQKQEIAKADGFVDTTKAIFQNPMAFSQTLARSAPDMLVGMGIGRAAAMARMGTAGAAADAAAARVAAAGGDLVAQEAAAKAVFEAAQKSATHLASTAGVVSEAGSSAYGAREGVYQEVMNMPDEKLSQAPRYQEILAKVGDPQKARQILANELADQTPMLTGLGTAAGSMAVSKLFGHDTTAELISGAEKASLKKIGTNIAQEGTEEVLQGIPEDTVQHGAVVQADTSHKLDLGGSVAQNFLAGAAMGGGGTSAKFAYDKFNDLRGKGTPTDTTPAAPPAVPPAAEGGGAVNASEILGTPSAHAARADTGNLGTTDTTESEKALRTPVGLTALDRVTEIDKALAAAPADAPETQTLRQERAELTKDWPTAIPGNATVFSTESGSKLQGQYALMDADQLVTSHDTNLRTNPAYPQELQPRERDRAASELQVSGIVQKLDPARLGVSADAATGAPIVGADGLVESGNARTIALKRVYQANGLKAQDYKQFLADNAAQFGITPESVQAMAKPVLVRVRNTPVNRAEFARQANASTVAQMSPSEQAKADSNRIESMDDLSPDENGDFGASRDFIRRFMARLPGTEQGGMIDADGKLSTMGYTRISNAVLAKAYGDSPVLARMVESRDDNLRNVSKALLVAAPTVAKMRQAMAQGNRFDADITPDLMAAVEELSRLKDSGTSVQDALSQAGMFGDKYSPETRALLQFLADNIRRPRRMADFIVAYMDALDAAGDPNQGSLLGDVQPPAKSELLTAAKKGIEGNGPQNVSTDTTQDTQRGVAGESAQAGQQDRGQPQDAPGSGRSHEGAGASGADTRLSRGTVGQSEWVDFPKESGTIGIPRAEMPQIKGEHRGALIQFLQGRGIEHKTEEVPASSLKPTQAEFSTKKAARWGEVRDGVDRSVLVSSDGHILDGHHQWVAALAANEPVKAIVLDAPIRELMANVFQFPSVKRSEGFSEEEGGKQARQEFKAALADLADLLMDSIGGRAMMVSANTPKLRETLVRLFDAAIKVVGTDLKAATKWVKEQLKANAETKPYWNKITDKEYQQAAMEALEQSARTKVDDLFAAAEQRQADLFGAEPAKPVTAMIDGRPYDMKRDNFVSPHINTFLAPEVISKADDYVEKYFKDKADPEISKEDRERAEGLLKPLLEKAAATKVEYDQKIIDIARKVGAMGQMIAPLKGLARAIPKLVIEENFNVDGMKDTLRSTIVVSSYADAQAVLDEITKNFELTRKPKNRTGDTEITYKGESIKPEDPAKFGGYSDLMVNVRMPNGVIAEIQINVPEMLGAKEGPDRQAPGHKLYEAYRDAPKESPLGQEILRAMLGYYAAAYAAASERSNSTSLKKSDSDRSNHSLMGPRESKYGRGSSELPSADKANQPSSGNSTKNPPSDRSPNRQPGGNTSGTLISKSFTGNVAQLSKNGYATPDLFGDSDGNTTDGQGGSPGESAGPAQATGSKRKAGAVRQGPGGRDQLANGVDDAGAAAQGEVGQPGAGGVRGQDEDGGRSQSGGRTGASTGVPAGRDIPAKTGLNYEFGPDDLTYEGSWAVKAENNVKALELLKQLDSEGRQATRAEQKVLARFVGWGSSEVANNIFGKKAEDAAKKLVWFDKAKAAIANGKHEIPMSNPDYWSIRSVLTTQGRINIPYQAPIDSGFIIPKNFGLESGDAKWGALRARIKAAMTEQEWAEASRSTQYAHYTSKAIVKSMWRAVERMGFNGGHILEPGAGIGVFPGLMPQSMAMNSSYTGIEYDSITGRILQQLFPDERIRVESFVDSTLPKNYYDVAAGNPPFSSTKILGDPEYAKHSFSLHDYFFAKSIDRVKPGGLVAFVTSRGTMDKLNDKARQYLADRADLVGAIRLPQTAFKQNAGTEVVTDVIFLRKKVPGETFEHAQDWLKTAEVKTPEGPAIINQYFAEHPEMVLGTNSLQGSMYRANEYTVLPKDGDIEALFDKAVENLPAGIYQAARGSAAEAAKVREIDFNPKAQKEGNYYLSDAGVLMVRESGVGQRVDGKSQKDAELIKSFVPLRDALKQAHYDQLNDGDWEASLRNLQTAYAEFVKKHGQVNQFTTKMVKTKVVDEETGETFTDEEPRYTYTLLEKLKDDPDYTLVAALEKVNDDTGAITPSAFLSHRVLGKPQGAQISTPNDALLAVLNDTGKVDIASVAHRLGMGEADTIAALGTLIYNDPESGWVMSDDYLSGNVKRKLDIARQAAKSDRNLERNVSALEAVQPAPKTPSQINASLGMNWIPGDVYEQFLQDTAQVKASVQWNDRTKQWIVQEKAGGHTMAATADWGTGSRNATELLEHALTGRPIRVTATVGTGADRKSVFDAASTEAANDKLNKLKDEFADWIWRDADRTDRLVRSFNDTFNTTVTRTFDGRHLTLPGTSKTYNIFDHVKRGAWRIIQDGNTYLAHAVGSGKTFQMVISAMEQKRLGLVKKPMMVVPNHMLQQFAREWQDLYPAARLMVADENNFHTENRRRFVSRVALSDLDGVVITHSAFKLLDLDPDFKQKMIEEQLEFMRAALEEAGGDGDKKGKSRDPRIKQIEKQIENMEEKLKAAMSSTGKDKNVRFDELGVDFLYVDEAHEFRKLDFTTTRQVKGISPQGSARAFDLYMKSRYLEEKTPGRSLVMASGTPVTNTLAELYTVQKFMDRQALIDRNIDDFDSWAAMFGRERTALEPNAAGKYEPVTRFSKFVNVPELTQMFREYADVLTADNLAEQLGDKRPRVDGGSRKIIVTPKTSAYGEYQDTLAQRVQESRDWKPSPDQPNNPDPIIKIIGDGRLAAIDMRFIDPALESDPDSKLNRLADDVIRTFKETSAFEYNDKAGAVEPNKGASMMVFSDLGFGSGVAESRGFNARAWFEKRLRDAGIPMSQVAFMSDYKKSSDKLKLFKDVNAGRVRVLVGSSKNMGTGVNAQQRLKAMFHLDSPWYPADLEQREGRIIRQGNKNPLVQIFAYAAKGTYDENMWKMLASKQYFIDQALSGDQNLREIEDLDSQSQYDLAAAMVAEDPRVLQLAGAKAEIEKLGRLYKAHEDQRAKFKQDYDTARTTIQFNEARMPEAKANADMAQDLSGDKFTAKAGGKTFTDRQEWAQGLMDRYNDLTSKVATQTQTVGEISGFKIAFMGETLPAVGYRTKLVLETPVPMDLVTDPGQALIGIAMRATNTLSDLARLPAKMLERISESRAKMEALETRLNTPFPMAVMLADKIKEAKDIEDTLAAEGKAKDAAKTEDGKEDGETALSRGTGTGMEYRELADLVAGITTKMQNMPKVNVLSDPSKAPKELQDYIRKQGAWGDVEGALHNGELYMFASGLASAMRAEHVLVEHEAAHFGLRAILGKELPGVMSMIWANNPQIRKAATELQKRGKLSNAEAVEEVIVDIPSSDLMRLKGWRKVVMKVRDFMLDHGFESMGTKLTQYLNGTLSYQQRADLMVADLVRSARKYIADKGAVSVGEYANVTRLSDGAKTLADDIAKQEKWLQAEARARGYADIDALIDKNYPLFEKLAALWREKNPADTLLSRSPVAKSAQERADTIIQTKAATKAPLDMLARGLTRVTGVEKVLGKVYDRAGTLLDRYTPEVVKAGLISDYGVPQAVMDQRSTMQGNQRQQLRKAGTLLEKLSTLTRSESRVAYEWMNMDGNDPHVYMSMMAGLPEESVKTLTEVQKLIDELSQEAMRLGQLSPEAFKRNRFAYLRRSYVKHTAELTKGEAGKRARVISILGDQYKGRGMSDSTAMKSIQNIAPEWWGRKLRAGKADASLLGEKFVRLERRAASGEGVQPLDGMEGKAPGKLLEVHYYPAGEALPAKYKDWNQSGTWEVRDVKGGNLVMWRDFTKDERERMGEIDEARFAIAKTLHGMIHDVEVGRYLEWLGQTYGKKEGESIPGVVVEASERYRDTFKPDEWVKVPDSKISGTTVTKYGKLAGQYIPGPIWNDLRQVVNGEFKPLGDTYANILRLWKTSKTALSPAVHTNNIMSNFVMADWHDVTAGHMAKALRIIMAASKGTDRAGLGGAALRAGSKIGIADAEAAREVLDRYRDSGGDIGGWVTQEIRDEQLKPLLDALEKELAATAGQSVQAQVGVMAALQHALMLRFPSAWDAFKAGKKSGKVANAITTEAANVLDLYQSEDDVFRLAAWLKAKEEGKQDLEAGKLARNSFLDYRINAPWVQAMRQTAWPFVSFSYRAVPMFLETAAKKPHKLMKLMLLAGAVNALGVMLAGGDDDKERKLLPEEKAGRIWGLVPKLIRMPWNDAHGSPVYLDIRRFIPVGDVFDVGAGHSAVPMLPSLTPGGPMVLMAEVVLNRSAFTGKSITLDTDTTGQQAAKVVDYLYKAFAPNLLGLPGTYATTGVMESISGRTDPFGREMSTAQALASSFGIKLGSYPADVLRRNLQGAAQAQIMEIEKNITQLKRQRQTNRIDDADFQKAIQVENEKKRKVMQDLAAKM